jgi:hypothetical protein
MRLRRPSLCASCKALVENFWGEHSQSSSCSEIFIIKANNYPFLGYLLGFLGSTGALLSCNPKLLVPNSGGRVAAPTEDPPICN